MFTSFPCTYYLCWAVRGGTETNPARISSSPISEALWPTEYLFTMYLWFTSDMLQAGKKKKTVLSSSVLYKQEALFCMAYHCLLSLPTDYIDSSAILMHTLNSLPTCTDTAESYKKTINLSTEASAKQNQLMEHQFVLQSKTCAGTHIKVTSCQSFRNRPQTQM